MAERDRNFRMKTASVTVIIVTPHFVVSNGNGVVTGETVISLIATLFPSLVLVSSSAEAVLE